jgi:hypothetical protein
VSEVFSYQFDPVLLPNETATLRGPDFPEDGQPVMCVAVGGLPEYQKDFGSLTAATWDRDNEDSNLEMGTNELAQLRMEILDDFKIELKNPSSTKQWLTNKTNFYLTRFPIDEGQDFMKAFFWRASEFYIWEDTTPRFDLYSYSAQSVSRVIFRGWRLKMRLITKDELTSRQEIWVSGWPSGK